MKNIMEINGYKAKIEYNPETELLRGEGTVPKSVSFARKLAWVV